MEDPAAKLMRGLTEALVLESLRREPNHGYGLLKELEDVFGEAPNRNRIYPLLTRLEEEGYVEGRQDPDSSRGKTTYQLTDAGRERLQEYESMPPSFQVALGRFWEAAGPGRPEAGRADQGDREGDGPDPDPGEAAGAGAGGGDREPSGGASDGEGDGSTSGDPADGQGGGAAGGGSGGETGGGGPADGDGDGAPAGGGDGGGMDLRRNPETGEVEMVIRGTHWGEVRIELGELRDED